ncbi:hypothetical protein CAPTEDRAFT_229222 [Capitella teleta]|uniref:Anaphase-promoting complex subunit 4-like WD40 domain-containing protein n=1 Tax=Capitella teleta TaxID=283909 RepID=R7TW53_CAPTE|nr:hypothetical protein CAPTEDRAFT_229222 [Capitella teleta]|eukprot:ELT97959.1 hypothetical protein CAPTEDRAFT_229222 [Capitella teleta]
MASKYPVCVTLAMINDGPCEVMCVQFSIDGAVIAVGYANGNIRIYNPDTGQCLHSLSDDDTQKRRLPVTSIRFPPYPDDAKSEHKNIVQASYASGVVKFWHFTSQKCLHTINEGRQTLSVALNPLGTKFVTVGADPKINVYDIETKSQVATLHPSDSHDVMNGHRARVFAAQYHPNQSHVFITGGWDDTVQIWDFNSGEKIKDVPQDHLHGSLIYTAQWLGRDCIVCGGCDQNMARIIDRGTLNTVGQLVDLPQGVYCLDNDGSLNKPRVAIGASKRVYVVKMEKTQ